MFRRSHEMKAHPLSIRKSEKQQQDKSEAHRGMQADVSNARKQYAISGGGAAKRCHTGFRSTFCFERGKVGGSGGQGTKLGRVGNIWAKRPPAESEAAFRCSFPHWHASKLLGLSQVTPISLARNDSVKLESYKAL